MATRKTLRNLLAATALTGLLAVPDVDARSLGGAAGAAGPPADQMTALLATMPANSWADAGAFVATSPTVNGVFWNCSATPCSTHGQPGVPSDAPTTTDVGTNTPSLMNQWAGGALDSDHEIFMVMGGGHQQYYGNEIYGFSLSALTWSRLSVPSSLVGFTKGGSAETFADGQPVGQHTYNGLVFVPGTGVFTLGICGQDDGGCSNIAFKQDLSALSPTAYNHWASVAAINGLYVPAETVAFDSVSNCIFATGNTESQAPSKLCSPFTGAWSAEFGNDQAIDQPQNSAIQPGSQMLVTGAGQFRAFSLTTGNSLTTTPGTGSDTTIVTAAAPGFEWDAHASKFVGWNGGKTVYLVDPSTYIITAHTATGTTPTCNAGDTNCTGATGVQGNGTYGRFRYDAFHNCFVVVNTIFDPVYVYKPDFLRRRWRRGERKPPRRMGARRSVFSRRLVRRAA